MPSSPQRQICHTLHSNAVNAPLLGVTSLSCRQTTLQCWIEHGGTFIKARSLLGHFNTVLKRRAAFNYALSQPAPWPRKRSTKLLGDAPG
jgi:hypothetical protein